jgi:hypothetical protein
MPKKVFASSWHKLRELVVLSLNIIYLKDTLQQCERLKSKFRYINMAEGSISIMEDNLRKRKHALNIRVKELLEDDLLLPRLVVIDIPNASLTKKQLDKGYAFFVDIQEKTIAFDLRKGTCYPISEQDAEEHTSSATMNALEYNAQHLGSVLKYFEIDQSDPLKGKDLRY